MKYILIMLWINYGSQYPHTSVVAEYNSLEACQAAGKAVYANANENRTAPSNMICTAKGKEQK